MRVRRSRSFRFGFGQIGAHPPQRLVLFFRMTRETHVRDQRGQKLHRRGAEEVVARRRSARIVGHDPGRDRDYILLLRPAEAADPIECIEADGGRRGIEHDHLAARLPPLIDDHRGNLARGVEHDETATPFERCRDRHRRRLEAARTREHDAMRGAERAVEAEERALSTRTPGFGSIGSNAPAATLSRSTR